MTNQSRPVDNRAREHLKGIKKEQTDSTATVTGTPVCGNKIKVCILNLPNSFKVNQNQGLTDV